MVSDPDNWRRAYYARCAAVKEVEDQELAMMSDGEAFAIIQSLNSFEGIDGERVAWSGLVEQQAIFQRGKGAA